MSILSPIAKSSDFNFSKYYSASYLVSKKDIPFLAHSLGGKGDILQDHKIEIIPSNAAVYSSGLRLKELDKYRASFCLQTEDSLNSFSFFFKDQEEAVLFFKTLFKRKDLIHQISFPSFLLFLNVPSFFKIDIPTFTDEKSCYKKKKKLHSIRSLSCQDFVSNEIYSITPLTTVTDSNGNPLMHTFYKSQQGTQHKLFKQETRSLQINQSKIQEIKLPSYLFLQKVDLSNNEIRSFLSIAGLSSCMFLEKLDLSCNEITEIQKMPYTFPSLKTLNLDNNKIRNMKGMGSFYVLETLDLKSNKIDSLEFLSKLHNLKILNIEWNPLKNFKLSTAYPQELTISIDIYQKKTLDEFLDSSGVMSCQLKSQFHPKASPVREKKDSSGSKKKHKGLNLTIIPSRIPIGQSPSVLYRNQDRILNNASPSQFFVE